jgi:hypothetical protein
MTTALHTPSIADEFAKLAGRAAVPSARDSRHRLPLDEAAAWRRDHVPASEEYQAEHGPARQPR